jgi:hypothetical protein
MVAALESGISQVSWSAQDTKKTISWHVSKHASFQSRAAHLKKTTTLYCGLSAEAKMRHFFHGIKGRVLKVPLAVIHNDDITKVDFSRASTFLLNFIRNDSRFKKTRRISGVGTRQGGRG